MRKPNAIAKETTGLGKLSLLAETPTHSNIQIKACETRVEPGWCYQVHLITARSGRELAAASAVDKVPERFLRAHII